MNNSMPDDEEVGRLVRDAGPYPSIPADDLTAIRRTARAEWQKHYGNSARSSVLRIALPLAAAIAGLAFLALWIFRKPPAVQAPVVVVIGSVERVTGDVRVWRSFNGAAELLHRGDKLHSGMVIATGYDVRSRAALRLARGQSLRLDAGSRVLLVLASHVRFDRGAVYIDSRAGVRDGLTISTAAGDFHPTGTQFEVRIGAGGSTQLRVREGEVSLKRGSSSVASRAGEALTIQRSGALVHGRIAPDDHAWDWVAEVAAIPPIEGRSLAWFLRWVARERGWKLVFEGDAASISETTTLHGSVDQLSIENALRSVTLSSGMQTRYANGTLTVINGSPTKSRPRR
jgi:ferric-dicitrate binding protein FerR (iron transport regulator)